MVSRVRGQVSTLNYFHGPARARDRQGGQLTPVIHPAVPTSGLQQPHKLYLLKLIELHLLSF